MTFRLILLAICALLLVGLPGALDMPGHPMSDIYDHAWGYSWFRNEVFAGRLPLWTSTTHWPPGGRLWFVDPVGALLVLPLSLVFSIPTCIGLMASIQIFLAMFFTLRLTEAMKLPSPVAAALAFGTSTYVLSCLHSGTLEYLNLAPFPLLWLGWIRRRPGWVAGAWVWACLGAFYYGAFAGIFLGLLYVTQRRRLRLQHRLFWQSVGWALVPLGVILWVGGGTLSAKDAVIGPESAPGWGYETLPVTDVLTFLLPRYHFPDNMRVGNQGILHSNYIGWVTLLAGGLGLWRSRYSRLGLWAGILALGPALCVAGFVINVQMFPVPLPLSLLYFPGSPFRFVHHPFRLVVVVQLVLAVGVAHWEGRWRWLGLLLLGEVLVVGPFPVMRASTEVPGVYGLLEKGGVIDFPPEGHLQNRLYTWYQTAHGQQIPYGVNMFVPEKLAAEPFFQAMMGCLEDVAVRATPREGGEPMWVIPLRRPLGMVSPGDRLLGYGFRYVVLHKNAMHPQEFECVAGVVGGDPFWEDGDQVVFVLSEARPLLLPGKE